MATPKEASSQGVVDPEGVTGQLCNWIHSISLPDVPLKLRTRAKYLVLDGLACAIVGAHLPWSETAAKAVFEMEPPGDCSIFGWNKRISPLAAALLNSTFIQGFELDDWHSEAPLHSNAILLPALFATGQHLKKLASSSPVTGADFLLALIVGYEVGPRVGLGLYGSNVLSKGWHSGAIFGPAAAAAAASKMMGLSAGQVEDAIGIACTQAGGLMSAQFESEVKRMQHGFAARNGLLGALLARGGYTGIKKVFERTYGGYLKVFSQGSGRDPPYLEHEISKGLGTVWKTSSIRVKPYAAMAGTHNTVDCIRALQAKEPARMKDLQSITSIEIEMAEAAYHHGGWKAERPLTSTGAQMSNSYIAATQLVDGEVLPRQFSRQSLDRDVVWNLVDRTTCREAAEFKNSYAQRITVHFEDESSLSQELPAPRGVELEMSNQETLEKWRSLTQGLIDEGRRKRIEEIVLGLEEATDMVELGELMAGITKSPI